MEPPTSIWRIIVTFETRVNVSIKNVYNSTREILTPINLTITQIINNFIPEKWINTRLLQSKAIYVVTSSNDFFHRLLNRNI